MKNRQRTSNIILAFFSILLALLLCEIGLRFLPFNTGGYFIWPPHFHFVLNPISEITPGIYGESRFIVNSKGIRGEEIPIGPAYKILTIGGSTTECPLLDQNETWQFLLQKRLTQVTNGKVWVGNAGKSGNTTRHNILQMKYLLPQFPDIDTVIIFIGINDLTIALSRDMGYIKRNETEQELLMSAFSVIPLWHKNNLPFYKNMAIWKVCKKIRYLIFSGEQHQDVYVRQYVNWKENRKSASAIKDTLPDMSMALEEYAKNINVLIDLGTERDIRLIFITQPTLWKAGLSKELQDLLWLGGIGNFQEEKGKEYYSITALSKGMDMYNATLLKVCKDRQVECIDLALMLPKDTTVFHDDCHFNESGSRKVSEVLAQYLLQHPNN
nr:SGNH/GDSL hydrolase family protein [Candidatus Omnitrophota bacterium]